MTDLFVLRPVVSLVLSLLIVLVGALGWQQLGVRETPDVDSPVVSVTTAWLGADPAIVETDVTEVLERELNGIEGVRTLSSSSQDGRSDITVEFELSRDLEAAANDVRSRVARARRRLPDDVDEPTVVKSDADASPILFLRVAAPGLDLAEISEIADTLLRDRLENVTGVSGLNVYGSRTFAIRLDLDPARMAARGVSVADLQAALDAANVDVPVGRIEGSAVQLTLRLAGGLRTPDEFAAVVIRSDEGRPVTVGDVADARWGAANERTAARADGIPSVTMSITPQAKANVVEVSDEVRSRLADIEADLPPGMTVDVVYDRAEAVRHAIEDVELTLLVAFVLVIAVIFAFLRDWRSTIVPAVAIPVSLIGTFLVLWVAGFTINVFTLFGMVLAIGLVVDDAIVVLENVVRHVELGEPPIQAAMAATREISRAVVATTLVLVVVFLPVLFVSGTTGRLFLEFGVTVAASVLISMVVALTLTPMLSSRLVVAARHGRGDDGEGWTARAFGRSLAFTMARPWLVLPALLAAAIVGAVGITTIPREFFPLEDRGTFTVRLEAREGATFDWTDAQVTRLEALLMPLVPERRMMLTRVAAGRGGIAGAVNDGSIQFPLVPASERERSQQEIVAALREPLAQFPGLRAVPTQSPTIGRGSSSPLQIVLQHADFERLAEQLPIFVAKMSALPGLSSVNENLKLDRPELRLELDRRKADALGVPFLDVARTLQVLTGGVEISTFKRGVREYPVIAELRRETRDEPSDLDGIAVRGAGGALVPLGALVTWEEQVAAATRYHYDRAPSATISANLDGITLGQGIERVQALARAELPAGFRTALAGESKEYEQGVSTLAQMFAIALLLVYLLLSAQFDSFVAPIAILLAVPLALAGALAALWVTGSTLSFFAQVGFILLVGLVTKNGILIVEYARHLGEQGLGPWEAAERAARLRLRPILMTSVATIGGAVPIAAGLSGASRSGLGIAVVGGMACATVLTLYVTPVVYAATAPRQRAPASR